MPDGLFAGMALSMDEFLRNARNLTGVPLKETMRMAVRTLARVLGLADRGKKHPAPTPDLTVPSPEGAVQKTIVAGETVYRAEEDMR